MALSLGSGAAGTFWVVVCSPQPIFNVFINNVMGGSSAFLGALVGVLSLAASFQILSIMFYARLARRKTFWIVTSTIHRLNGFVLAAVAFSVAGGGAKSRGLDIILAAMTASWIMTNISASGWWSWMADIIPEKIRAGFFGRRSSIANIVNIAWFFSVTLVLDAVPDNSIFVVYGIVFIVGGVGGVVDILLHLFIPDRAARSTPGPAPVQETETDRSAGRLPDQAPVPYAQRPPRRSAFVEPLRNRNFVGLCVAVGLALFSINVAGPFIAPYITAQDAVGAPNTWLGIMFVISQLIWILVSPAWGVMMDRFGRKSIVVMGLLFTLSWIGYFFVNHTNFTFILPIIALVGGVLAPAFWDGTNQLMLSLTPEKNRLPYVAWYWTIIGVISAFGSFLGGVLDDYFRGVSLRVLPGFSLRGLQIVILISLALILLSVVFLLRIREGRAKPVGFVFSIVTNPGIFRTFFNMGTISRTAESYRVARALRSIEGSTSNLALEEVLSRLQDPDAEVREEAARALGRIGSSDAFDALVAQLTDPGSTIRSHAARALGRIGDARAIPYLIEGLASESDDLKEACLFALGEIGGDAAVRQLLEVFAKTHSDRVVASGASAVSKLGILEAAWEIVPRMHQTTNLVLRNQLAIALGNILGRPGEFYQYITGSASQKEGRVGRLFQEAQRNLQEVLRGTTHPIAEADQIRIELSHLVRSIREHVENERNTEAMALLEQVAATILEKLLPSGTPVELYLEYAVAVDARLALWWWFLCEASLLAGTASTKEVVLIDVLLGIYFLSVYQNDSEGP